MNIDTAKSYATEENLTKALTKLGIADWHPMIVRNREGRFTAVFTYSFVAPHTNPFNIARLGFKVLG
jgi:3-mercaptopyruvate sulfurtransferase SseA